jgi:hypothetical protein
VSYVSDQIDALEELFVYGVPGSGGGPIPAPTGGERPVRRRVSVREN